MDNPTESKPAEITQSPQAVAVKKLKPVHIDGILYVLIAVSGSAIASLSTDEAVKLISPETIFWVKFLNEAIGAGALALKTYRSTSYAKSTNGDETNS